MLRSETGSEYVNSSANASRKIFCSLEQQYLTRQILSFDKLDFAAFVRGRYSGTVSEQRNRFDFQGRITRIAVQLAARCTTLWKLCGFATANRHGRTKDNIKAISLLALHATGEYDRTFNACSKEIRI